VDGVFKDLVGERAFLDKKTSLIWGKRKTVIGAGVIPVDNKPIGGGHRIYARLLRAKSTSGNSVGCKYGLFTKAGWRRKLAPLQITLKSDLVPISCAESLTVDASLVRTRYRERVSQVELTFDISTRDIPEFGELERSIFTTARKSNLKQDARGRKTLYVGSPRSPLQLRLYQKTDRITRFEFILRAPFLRSLGIVAAHELILLRQVDFTSFVKWPIERSLSIFDQLSRHESGWKLWCSLELWRHSSQEVECQLKNYGVDTTGLFIESTLDRTLRRMQKRLIW
jgi:hypothetical protein